MRFPWQKTSYQLVLEFFADSIDDYDRMIECELKLGDLLRRGDVDGHDTGGGVFNFFLITREPVKCFKEALSHLTAMNLLPVSAGYRALEKDDYIRLWPKNDATPFELH